ncbi:MAG: TetR/AcrR family transcriptional regulator [Thermoanaerobaculia bacterium]
MTLTKAETTRELILETALAAASEIGFEGLSLGDLAKRVGMSKSGLFAHFSCKDDLELEILKTAARRFLETVVAPALAAPRGEPRVRALFERWFDWSSASELPGGCVFIAAASELDDRPGPLRDYLVSSQRDWLATLAQAARIAVAEGHFRADLDVDQFAHDVYSILLAYHHFHRLLHEPNGADRAHRTFDGLLRDARRPTA